MKRKASVLEDTCTIGDWVYSDASSTTASPESVHAASNAWRISAIPYLNSRTQKRYRDNRPDQESIHQNTITKLFEAQRRMHDTEMAEQRRSHLTGSYLMSLDTVGSISEENHYRDPGQQSLDAFFGGPGHVHSRPQSTGSRAELKTKISNPLPRCEDCASALQLDSRMYLDLDTEFSAWSCARCSREVCDTCAVNGNQRLCLECAMRGSG